MRERWKNVISIIFIQIKIKKYEKDFCQPVISLGKRRDEMPDANDIYI